ncbi:tail protein [Shigella sonnei]|nr:tail protein [Shigella sonnei]
MMMIYGMFVFELRTLPHQQLQQNKSWRHVKNWRRADLRHVCPDRNEYDPLRV